DIVQRGSAIECRINAEDPSKDFRPSAGTITKWHPPGGQGIRLDTHVVTGYRVPPNYDSMVAKLLAFQPTRAEAIATMRRALREFTVEGIATTIPIHQLIMNTAEFANGTVDTTFIERTFLQK
ncbi:MAG: acetyl-CoA carboxylase biotin carboxylase subunit, partial [Gemmataceae bacterium]